MLRALPLARAPSEAHDPWVAPLTPRQTQVATVAASLAVHAALVGAGLWLALGSATPATGAALEPAAASSPAGGDVSIDLPAVGQGVDLEPRPVDPRGDPPQIAGGETVPRPDTGSAGRGGESSVDAPALNLADLDERMRLSPDLVSRVDRDQLQRLRVARARQSWDDRRSTTHPTELTLLVTGRGPVLERRPDATRAPSRGALASIAPSVLGGDVGEDAREGVGPVPVGGANAGTTRSAPGAGLATSTAGLDHHAAAPIASARPDVVQGPVAVPSRDAARPRDDVDSEQEVATTLRSLVHASTAGGAAGEGTGGVAGGGAAGAGAIEGTGSRALPLGIGQGEILEFWTRDPRLLPYFRALHAKIDPLWANAFPRSALYDLKQGTVILVFTVTADGQVRVQWPPARPSGVDEFDRNCAEAVRRAAPLPPIPASLGVTSLTIRAPFVASNPAVK